MCHLSTNITANLSQSISIKHCAQTQNLKIGYLNFIQFNCYCTQKNTAILCFTGNNNKVC